MALDRLTYDPEEQPVPNAADLARGWLEHSPFVRHLGVRAVSVETDEVRVEMPFSEHLPTAGEVVHGGAIGALVDIAATAAAWSGADVTRAIRWGTVSLSLNFVSPAVGQSLIAVGRVSRRGKSLCFCEVDVLGPDEVLVAQGLVTYRLA